MKVLRRKIPEETVTTEHPSADKGRRLESEIAHALTAGGYAARRNVVREGRSGARHEIDVLKQMYEGGAA